MEQRKLMLPAFHGERMQRLTGLMTELTERELESWPRERAGGASSSPAAADARDHPAGRVRARAGPAARRRCATLLTEVLAFSESPLSVLPALQRVAGWIAAQRALRQARMARTDELIFELIEERARRPADDRRDDVLAMLLAGPPRGRARRCPPQEIRDELMTALVAGHETTASQLAWAFERLAREPGVRARLADGARRRRERRVPDRDDQRDPAAAARAAQRRAAADQAAGRDRRLRATRPASRCWPAPTSCTTTPTCTPSPYAFRPERFVGKPPGTYTWIPFGGGRRRCLGASFALQEMKIVLRAVLRALRARPGRPGPSRPARRSITFSPTRGATVRAASRAGPRGRRPPQPRSPPPPERARRAPGRGVALACPWISCAPSARSIELPAAAPLAGDPDGGGQEVRRRPGREPGGAGRLLRVLLAVPAAAGVRRRSSASCCRATRARSSRSSSSVLGQFPVIGKQIQVARAARPRARAGDRPGHLAARPASA